jgi:hypothetical protein
MAKKDPNDLVMAMPEISEKVRERNAVATLRRLGYKVHQLGKPIPVRCRRCQTEQYASLTGNDTGVSDVLVSHRSWPGQCYRMLETKKSDRAKRRREQIDLAEEGFSTFYVTEEQAVRSVIDVERRMGLEPNPLALAWLRASVPGNWGKDAAALLGNDTPNAAWRP